ncbi:MAG: hypothetical protein LBT50_01540, partial [Prevotellaceae bacterium]|nr:hypothetical protein [Prevotellaceae bacterium]
MKARYFSMDEKFDIFYSFWQQLQQTHERVEFAENFYHWNCSKGYLIPSPKSLGFVTLSPVISLTAAGQELIQTKRKEEIFLRQLLKFQLPSSYHKP